MNKMIRLNAVKDGIAVYLFSTKDFLKGNAEKDENGKYIIHPEKNKLFKNTATARAFLHTRLGIDNPYDYKFWFFVDGKEFDFDDCQYFPESGYYEYFSGNDILFIQEENINRVTNIGYFTFAEPDEMKGSIICKSRLHSIKKALNEIVKYPESEPAVYQIGPDANNHMCASIKGSTAKIHILTNSQIMDLNTKRKEYGLRCVPYLKEMDKFKTIYFYVTKDINDFADNSLDEKVQKLLEMIVEVLNNIDPELSASVVPVEFKGTITDNYEG